MTKCNVRSLLRDRTSALHRQAENALESKAPIESRQGLSKFLGCMLMVHTRFRTEYDRAAELAGLQTQSGLLIKALQDDLNISSDATIQTSICDDHFSLGVGYVLEGSALGASMLKKRLTALDIEHPCYLTHVTTTSKTRWPKYVKYIDTCEETDPVVAGALLTFEYIIAHAERPDD